MVQCPGRVYAGLASHKWRIPAADKNIDKSRTSPILRECLKVKDVGAADKAAIQLVEVQPYQLLVSDT